MTIRRCVLSGFLMLALVAGFCAVSMAQTETPAATSAAPAGSAGETSPTKADASMRGMTVQEILESGGRVMYVLAGLSILTVAFVVFFSVVLRQSQVAPTVLHREVVERVRAGAVDDARRACEYRSSPLSAVVLASLDYLHDLGEVDAGLLKDVIEGEGSRQAEAIQGQTQYLLDIAVVSPMVGLLGTVFGMLKAFSAVALDIAKAKPIVLASGVSQALITTAFGLIVGITAMIFYAIFRRRAAKMISKLESASTDVLTALLSASQRTP